MRRAGRGWRQKRSVVAVLAARCPRGQSPGSRRRPLSVLGLVVVAGSAERGKIPVAGLRRSYARIIALEKAVG